MRAEPPSGVLVLPHADGHTSSAVSWLGEEDPKGATPLDRVFGLRPNLHEDYRRFVALFWEKALVDPVILELCRLRVAMLLDCEAELAVRSRPALAAGLDEAKIAELARAGSCERFTPAERACIAFAELFVADPQAITDADAAAVTDQLGDAGLVALVEALAIFDGFTRFRLLLDVPAPSAEELAKDPWLVAAAQG